MSSAHRIHLFHSSLLAVASLALAFEVDAQSCSLLTGPKGKLEIAAGQVVQAMYVGKKKADEAVKNLDPHWPALVSRAAVAALVKEAAEPSREDAGLVGEVVRNDKQLGASASSGGTTTLTERAAFSKLLGLAVEHGAIRQEQNGTSLTLSTSPYAVLAAVKEDNDELYRENAWARFLGLSANFSLEGAGEKGLNDLQASELSSLSAKFVLGDRSPRSENFSPRWKTIQPSFQKAINAEIEFQNEVIGNRIEGALVQQQHALEQWTRTNLGPSVGREAAQLDLKKEGDRGSLTGTIADEVEKQLCTEVFEKVKKGEISVVSDLEAVKLVAEVGRIEQLREKALGALAEQVTKFQEEEPLFALSYSLNRVQDGSDYSEIRLIGDGLFFGAGGPLTLVANARVSINHDLSRSTDQDRFRDYGGSLSLEWTVPNRLTGQLPGQDPLSKIAMALSADYTRLEDTNKDIGTALVKVDLPVTGGFDLPLSLSYATRTETSSKDDFKIGVGVSFDTEKLLALAKLAGF